MAWFFNMLSFGVGCLGFRGIALVSWVLGILAYDILRIRRRIVFSNLTIVYKDQKTPSQKHAIGRRSYIYFIRTTLEFLAAKKLFHKAKVTYTNSQFAQRAMAKGMGFYGLCIHMGNWELLCHLNSKKLAPIHVVVKPIGKGALAKWVEDVRKAIGYQIIDRKGAAFATTQIFKALERKEVVGFIVDQKRSRGERLPFFGREASTNNSLAKLYAKHPAPVLPAMIVRKGIGEFEVIYFEDFMFERLPAETLEEYVSRFTLFVNKQVERMILQRPEEYFWMHNRWELSKNGL